MTEQSTTEVSERAGTKRLMVTMTKRMWVDVYQEEADGLLNPSDYLNVYEAVDRFQRISAHGTEHIDSDVTIEADDDDGPSGYWTPTPVDGNGRQRFLWSARHFVGEARRELSTGRYREGRCPELDKVNGVLARAEDDLRLMALDAEGAEWPEVKAWQEHRRVGEKGAVTESDA